MGKIVRFFKGPGFVLVLVAAFFVGFYFLRTQRARAARAADEARKQQPNTKLLGQMSPEQRRVVDPNQPLLKETVNGAELVAVYPSEPVIPAPTPTPKPVASRSQPIAAPAKAKPPKLIQSYTPERPTPPVPTAPQIFAPSSTLIPCALVLTVDSSSLETPVLAEVTQDVWQNSTKIIEAGTLAYAFASKGHMRDRIEVNGNWTLVFKDGREYKLRGIALDRVFDASSNRYGLTDGSAGIRGRVLESDEFASWKLFLSTAISGVASSGLETTNSIYGPQTTNSLQNSGIKGAQAVLDRYAQRLEEGLAGDGTFVRVTAGTEFYIFPLNVIEPELASVAALTQKEVPKNSWELNRDAYEAHESGTATASGATAPPPNQAAAVQASLAQREALLKQIRTQLDAQKQSSTSSKPANESPARPRSR